MRALTATSALALLLAAGVAAAQQPSAQVSPQNGQSPATVKQEADEAARERLESTPSKEGATLPDARGGVGNPAPDQVGGPPEAGPVPVRGDGLELPGATAQTAPAKFSQHNDELDEYSIMGYPVQLSGEQRQEIWRALGGQKSTASTQDQRVYPEAGVFLPPSVQAEEIPGDLDSNIPALQGLKYVKTGDKILLVAPANGIVRGVVEQ